MADLINLYEIAQASGRQAIYVAADRCLPVQHRRSSCRRCIEACPVDAITYENRKLELANATCIGCGACATVCPTEALIPIDPTEPVLRRDALASMGRNKGVACIACARIVARENFQDEQFAEVPCLCRVNESVLLSLVAEGASEVLLVDGGCRNCKYRDCDPVTESVVENANALLASQGSALRVKRVQAFPSSFEEKPQEQLGAARRAAFEDAGTSTKGLLGRAAKMLIKQETVQNKATSMIVGAMGIDLDDPEPLAPERQERLLDALFAIGEANGFDFLLPDDERYENALESAGEDTEGEGVAEDAGNGDEGAAGTAVEGAEGADAADAAADSEGTANAEGASGVAAADGEAPKFDGPTVDTRFFGWFELNSLRCNKCGICAVVCKQDALKRTDDKMPDGERAFLAFSPAACVQCNLCAEACFRKAITITSEVPLSELFSFDPVLLRA